VSDSKQTGFTIPELVVGISVAGIIFLALLSALTNFFVITTRNNARIDMTASSESLLRATVDALRLGDGVRQTNSISDPNAPVGGWNTTNTNFVIVIETPAYSSSRDFIIDSDTGSPYMNELVYYKSGSSMLRRNLANPSAVGNTLKTSCPANVATATCPADAVLSDYVQSLTFTLYDQDNNATSDPLLARSVAIQLINQRRVFGDLVSFDNKIRVTLRNKF
jgi:prepilin-type N-terminal cleavage/methylation domain-containing protein